MIWSREPPIFYATRFGDILYGSTLGGIDRHANQWAASEARTARAFDWRTPMKLIARTYV